MPQETEKPAGGERLFRSVMAALIGGAFLALIWIGKDVIRPAPTRTIVVYAFSTMEDALNDGVFPAFQEKWRDETGERVEIVATFAGSGAVTTRILERIPAEVAILSSQLDVVRLLDAGVLSAAALKEAPYGDVLARTPFVLVVREGNPKGVHDYADLARSGVEVLHADPATSGAAQWSILAAYGSALRRTGDPERAYEQLLGLWRNVTLQVASARLARLELEKGVGDVLITYEQDVIGHPSRRPVAGEIVYPPSTILSEPAAVRLDKNVTGGQRVLVGAFFDFLWSYEAQQIFVAYGFRSPLPELEAAGPVPIEDLFTLDDLGGPRQATREILDGVWHRRVLEELGAARE